jgi:hypothetical protein
MNSKEDERVAHCSVEEWEAGSIRVARVGVEIDVHLAGSYLTTDFTTDMAHDDSGWSELPVPSHCVLHGHTPRHIRTFSTRFP